jgi:hypothetical protein
MTIIPDAQDWSWVLERLCPECGFDAAAFPAEEAGQRVRDDAVRWRHVLTHPDAEARPDATTWSATEYACHVRDVADLFAGRLHLMLTEDDPRFASWDQDQVALEDEYSVQRAASVSTQITLALTQLAETFEAVRGDAWERRGMRGDGSRFSSRTLAQYFLHDEIHHLYDVNG